MTGRSPLRLMLLAAAVAAGLAAPSASPADSPGLQERRTASCGTSAFEALGGQSPSAYQHRRFKVRGETNVGGAVLEWCQSATNAVLYFYVDDPQAPAHAKCPENMSFAVFPGQGGETREIIEANVASYHNPQVRLIEPPKTGPVTIAAGGRTIEAYQLEGVVEQGGMAIRKRMIGYDKGGDFVRVMTGYRDDAGCGQGVVQRFLAELRWP